MLDRQSRDCRQLGLDPRRADSMSRRSELVVSVWEVQRQGVFAFLCVRIVPGCNTIRFEMRLVECGVGVGRECGWKVVGVVWTCDEFVFWREMSV